MQLHNVRDNIVKGLKAEALSTDYRSGSQAEAIEVRLNETKLERREHEMEIMNVIGFHFSWLVYFRILLSLNFDLPMHENNNLKPMHECQPNKNAGVNFQHYSNHTMELYLYTKALQA